MHNFIQQNSCEIETQGLKMIWYSEKQISLEISWKEEPFDGDDKVPLVLSGGGDLVHLGS